LALFYKDFMGLLFVLWIFLSYAVLPGIISSFAIGLLAAVVALFRKSSGNFLPTFARMFIGGVVISAIAGAGGIAFVFFNAYILDNAAFRGQGMGYALLLVPLLAVTGAVLGSIGAAVSQQLLSR
jgi:hypothetical protein